MHSLSQMPATPESSVGQIDFAWLELTNRCNLSCRHCYTESGPDTGDKDLLTPEDYLRLIDDLADLGCRKLQFIGGEPTLNGALPRFIEAAASRDFEFIEVFTNLVRLPDELLSTFQDFNVAVATSFYSHDAAIHELITGQAGSFGRTVRNIRRVLDANLTLRAGVILMELNAAGVDETWQFLQRLGVKQIGSDHVRKFGRADSSKTCEMGELCGSCAGSIVSIGPDGSVAPCNMSRSWKVGSVLEQSLSEIVSSSELAKIRLQIGESVRESEGYKIEAFCTPKTCGPYSSCCPSTQSCSPCSPNSCSPCYPKG